MVIRKRNTSPDLADLVSAHNGLKLQVGSSVAHLDAAEYYTTALAYADATTLATAIALANQLRAISLVHRADTLIHKAVDNATITAPAATDLTSLEALLNEQKSDYATHIASTAIHFAADATNTITAADATDQASAITLVNAIKAAYIAHFALAPTNSGALIRLVSA